MKKNIKLSKKTTLQQFENNYWYALELKEFAKTIGLKATSRLRKDQLEIKIREYIETGSIIEKATESKKRSKEKDYELSPLTMETQVMNYCSNAVTKAFILSEAEKIQTDLPKKSGVWYWVNRWREEQLQQAVVTYGDIVHQFIELSNKEGKLPRIPSTKFNNFIGDFLDADAGSRAEAMQAWSKHRQRSEE